MKNFFFKRVFVCFVFSCLLVLFGREDVFAAKTVIKVGILSDGMYEISAEQLKAVGVQIPLLYTEISLTHKGEDVPIRFKKVTTNKDFLSESSLLFYGRGVNKRDPAYKYTETNVYLLTFRGDRRHKPVLTREVTYLKGSVERKKFSTTIHAEENNFYSSDIKVAAGGDRWFYDDWQGSGQETIIDIPTPDIYLNSLPLTCSIRVNVVGSSDDVTVENDHNTTIILNNKEIGSSSWDGYGSHLISFNDVPCRLYDQTATLASNQLKIYSTPLESNQDAIYIDWVELDYFKSYTFKNKFLHFTADVNENVGINLRGNAGEAVQIYDITDVDKNILVNLEGFVPTENLVKITDKARKTETKREYFAVTNTGTKRPFLLQPFKIKNLKDEENGVDYIIITPQYLTNVEALAQHREEFSNLSVMTVSLESIYNEFGYGFQTPVAIKDFLSYAYTSWVNPPKYVVLIGDGSFDPKGQISAFSYKGNMPAYLFTSSIGIEAPSDSWYADVVSDDSVEDIAIGRIPVRTSAELDMFIDKIITYETGAVSTEADNLWTKKVLFVADNANYDMEGTYSIGPEVNMAHDFSSMASGMSTILGNFYQVSKIFLSEMLLSGSDTKSEIVDSINNGALVTTFVGHGLADSWGYEGMLKSEDISSLNNPDRLTFAVSFNNLNGYFISSEVGEAAVETLSETFLITEGKGAIGSWMPSLLTLSENYKKLGDAFFSTLSDERSDETIGNIIKKAKLTGYNVNASTDALNSMILFADPALKLRTDKVMSVPEEPVVIDTTTNAASSEGGGAGGGGCFIKATFF